MSLRALFVRETALAWDGGGGPLIACGFYAGVATLGAFSLGAAPDRLAMAASGAAWLALALAALLSLERMFARDYEDGALDLLILGAPPLELVCAVKCLAHWLTTGAPLALAAALAAPALGAPAGLSPLLFACALLGSLAFSFVGGLGAALSLGARRGGVLIAVIVLPLFAPPVIFGAGAASAWLAGLPWIPAALLLGGYSLAAVALAPLAMAAACRNAAG